MKIHDVAQGSDEWLEVRRGKFTASLASKLITPTGKLSTQYKGEMGRIIAEVLDLQEPENTFTTEWMERGTELEAEARLWFELESEEVADLIGFVEDDSGLLGASPDAAVLNDEGLIPVELKCPKPGTHIQWMLDGKLPDCHKAQVHFQMALLKAPYGYFMSYHPYLGPLLIRVDADDYTDSLSGYLDQYIEDFKACYKEITGEDYATAKAVKG